MGEIYKEIDLSELPKKKYGNKERIDWKNAIGYKCEFKYDDILGEVEIINHKNTTVYFKYNKDMYNMKSTSFIRCCFGRILNKITNDFKIEIGTIFKDDKRDLYIIDREHRKDKRGQYWKWYKYHCNIDGYDGWIVESSLLKNRGCSCCDGKSVVEGVNDIPTTAQWMVKYFQGGYDDAKKYTLCSGKKIRPICPDCGRVSNKAIKISNLYNQNGFGCNCKDGTSYPNKFMFNILEQLNVDFKNEFSPKWANGRRYDFYDKSNNIIIEMDGKLGHGKNDTKELSKNESKIIDEWKDLIAQDHGITVVRIDCCYDNNRFEYIKNNILNSKLLNYYNFNCINWNEVDEYATSSLIKEICEFYENHKNDMLLKDICSECRINGSVMLSYLKQGNKFGWCNYNKKYTMTTRSKLHKPHNCRKVMVFEINETFESATLCANELSKRYNEQFTPSSVIRACQGIQKSYKGFTFKYLN